MQKCRTGPLQQNGQKTPGRATTAKQAKKRRASPPDYDIGSGLGQSALGSNLGDITSPEMF